VNARRFRFVIAHPPRHYRLIGGVHIVEEEEVLRTYREGGEHLVECEVYGVNQRGERNCMGMAVVALPSRSDGR
jgi:hypothetical protein